MPIHYRWYNSSETIHYVAFVSTWTWQDLENMIRDCLPLVIAREPIIVDSIFDFTASRFEIPSILTNFRNKAHLMPDNYGILVAVGGTFIESIVNALLLVQPRYQNRIFFARSLAAAEERINQAKATRFPAVDEVK